MEAHSSSLPYFTMDTNFGTAAAASKEGDLAAMASLAALTQLLVDKCLPLQRDTRRFFPMTKRRGTEKRVFNDCRN